MSSIQDLPKTIRELLQELSGNANLTNKKKLDMLTSHILAEMTPVAHAPMLITDSGVSHKTKQPYVTIAYGTFKGQFTPDEARQFGLTVIQTAEAAVQDAIVYNIVTSKLGLDAHKAAAFIVEMRNARPKFKGLA